MVLPDFSPPDSPNEQLFYVNFADYGWAESHPLQSRSLPMAPRFGPTKNMVGKYNLKNVIPLKII